MKAPVEIRILLGRVIMVCTLGIGMPIEGIEIFYRRTIGLCEAIDRIPIERVGDRCIDANDGLQMDGWQVVMVIVCPATMTSELIKLPDEIRIVTAIVQRIKNRDTIRGDRDRSSEKPILGRHR